MLPVCRTLFAFALVALLSATPALGGVTLEFREVGGNVELSGGGKLNLSAWTFAVGGAPLGGAVVASESVFVGPPGAVGDVYQTPVNFSGPASIGPGLVGSNADSGTGHSFGLAFAVPALGTRPGASSSTPLNGSSTWLGETLASIGITPGSYRWTWGSGGSADSFTVHAIGGACVDADDDGYGAVGHVDCRGGLLADCDDTNPLIHPNAADVCDGVDNNCKNGADEENVCDAGLIDGGEAQLVVTIVGLGDLINGPVPVVLGAPEVVGANLGGGLLLDLDIENDSIAVLVDNTSGGLGNAKIIASVSGLDWIQPNTQIVGASVSSDFDYVYAAEPEPFTAPGLASIVDNGHGVEIFIEELLWQSGEAHSVDVSFASSPGAANIPALPPLGIGALLLTLGGLGIVRVRRGPGRS